MAKQPPVKRRVQRQSKLATRNKTRVVESEIVTLADLAEMRVARRRGVVPTPRTGTIAGASGTNNVLGRIYNEDYNRLFDGKAGLTLYDQMGRSDGQTGAAADIIKFPLRASTHTIIAPENASPEEKAIAEAVQLALFGEGMMREPWDFYYRHLLMRVDMGFGLLEKEWMFDEDNGVYRFARLHPRLPKTVDQWVTDRQSGQLIAIVQYVPLDGRAKYLRMPAENVVLSVREREGDNWWGKSIYRRIYKHWFYKEDAYKIDAIRLDRYGVGIPVAKIEQGHSTDDAELDEIENILLSLRGNARSYIIETPGVTFRIMTPENGTGGVSGLQESVNHHDSMIVRGVLATFISDHSEGLNTNRTGRLADIFLHSLKAEAAAIDGDIDAQIVRPFCDVNFDMAKNRYPHKVTTGLSDVTLEALGVVLAPFVSAGLVTPDDEIEDVLRKLMQFPPLMPGFKRGDKKEVPPQLPAAGGNADAGGDTSATGGEGSATNPRRVAASDTPERLVALFNENHDEGGRFASGSGGGAASGTVTPDQRGSNAMTTTEAHDPAFHSALQAARQSALDPDASDFERNNPIAIARAEVASNRPFVELHKDGSQAYYRDPKTGGYTAERQAEHEAIVGHYLTKFGPPQENPEALFTGGLPGSGKTSGLRVAVPDFESRYVNLNNDDIKGMLKGYTGTNAGWLHEEADHVMKIVLAKAVDARQNVLIDSTMKALGPGETRLDDGLLGRIKAMKAAGYKTSAVYMETDLKNSAERAMARYVRDGRYVPPSYIRSAKAADPSRNTSRNIESFHALKPLLDSWTHFDTRVPKGDPPKMVARSAQ